MLQRAPLNVNNIPQIQATRCHHRCGDQVHGLHKVVEINLDHPSVTRML